MKQPHSSATAALTAMPDMQQTRDHRKIPIQKVGVKDISYPIVVQDKHHNLQHTVARVDMYVDLPHPVQGHPHEPLR